MQYKIKTATFICILIFILNLSLLFNIKIVDATIWDNVSGQMQGLAKTSGYSESGNPTMFIENIVANIIQYILSFLGVIFIILIIYAGFLWMTASGDSEKIAKAKDILINAVIGIIIILSAYIITATIFTKLGAATGT